MRCPLCGTLMTPCDNADYFRCAVCKARWGKVAIDKLNLLKNRERLIDERR